MQNLKQYTFISSFLSCYCVLVFYFYICYKSHSTLLFIFLKTIIIWDNFKNKKAFQLHMIIFIFLFFLQTNISISHYFSFALRTFFNISYSDTDDLSYDIFISHRSLLQIHFKVYFVEIMFQVDNFSVLLRYFFLFLI